MEEKVSEQAVSFTEFLKDSANFKVQIHKDGAKGTYDKGLSAATKDLLATEFMINGHKMTPAHAIANGLIAHVMENPTPINVKTLQDIVGDSVVKVDVGGMGIEKFLETVRPDEKEK